MKLGVLFSGGKDSNFALFEAVREGHDIGCLITMKSEKDYSYMFQSAGVDVTKFQAEALGVKQIFYSTCGEKELELDDLREAILKAKEECGIEGVVTGAINSIYQASRVQRICSELGLFCFNPLWQKEQVEFLEELVEERFEVMIVGVASYPFDSRYLGRVLDSSLISELKKMSEKFLINPAGEGGELETFVLDSPVFKKRVEILDSEKVMDSENSGELILKKVRLVDK